MKSEDQEEQFYKVEAYIKGQLSEKEKKAFEQRIDQSPELAAQVEQQRLELEGLEYLLEKDLRSKMQHWKFDSAKSKPRYNPWIIVLIIIILAVSGIFYIATQKQNHPTIPSPRKQEESPQPSTKMEERETTESPKKRPPVANEQRTIEAAPAEPSSSDQNRYLALAENTYTLPEHLSSNLKSAEPTGKTAQTALEGGIEAFSSGDYPQALASFQKVIQEDSSSNERYELAYEWMAHTHFKMQDYEKAADKFRTIVNSGYAAFIKDRAEWYLLLSMLPNYPERKEETEALIEKMTEPENYHLYEDSAKALSDRLEKK